ncbi:MAG: hypothetical protein IPJ17_04925 [Holophagales bacterium]|nr:MAG: hypothetical protein IPJ17_04925 [Holophagales bacterium]
MLREISRALLDAIAESGVVTDGLRRLHREGYTLHLLLDCQRDGATVEPTRPVPSRADVAFRIDADDLAFLRSIGIDPTRRRRRPRPATD